MEAHEKYWNPVLETMEREKLRRLQYKKFMRIFTWAYEKSQFHRKLYHEAGVEPGDIKTFEDIARVPKVEKSMMRSIQNKDPFPYGRQAGLQASPFTSRTHGRIGNGGLNAGHTFSIPKATGGPTVYLYHSGTIFSSRSGRDITGAKKSAAKWSLAAY